MGTKKDTNLIELLAFENGNHAIKSYGLIDGVERPLVIQAVYRDNPRKESIRMNALNEASPLLVNPVSGKRRLWGYKALQGQHESNLHTDKLVTMTDAFRACLQPHHHNQEIRVVTAHWDSDQLEAVENLLMGVHHVIKNGQEIKTQVVSVKAVLEGLGSFWTLSPNNHYAKALIMELGFGTAEIWLVNNDELMDGKPIARLAMNTLCQEIREDPALEIALKSQFESSLADDNVSVISQALNTPTFATLTEPQWRAIKSRYALQYFEKVRQFIKLNYREWVKSSDYIILTGGGGAFLRQYAPEVDAYFDIPENPQTASVMGLYKRYA